MRIKVKNVFSSSAETGQSALNCLSVKKISRVHGNSANVTMGRMRASNCRVPASEIRCYDEIENFAQFDKFVSNEFDAVFCLLSVHPKTARHFTSMKKNSSDESHYIGGPVALKYYMYAPY